MGRLRSLLVVIVCLLAIGVMPVLAHDGAEDVAWVMLSGTSESDGHATLRVDVAELAACDRLEPLRLAGVRADLKADGTLERIEPCRFEGEIDLPEPGRWMVAARFAYDDREAEVWMPVGVTDTAQTFERGDWLHAVAVEDSGWDTTRMLLLVGLGLGVGAALTMAYRWWRGPREGSAVTAGNRRRVRGG
jgi:hypothetical protein